MAEISCIANDADDLQLLGLTSRPQFLLPMRPGVGPISNVMLLRAWRERLSAVVWSEVSVIGAEIRCEKEPRT